MLELSVGMMVRKRSRWQFGPSPNGDACTWGRLASPRKCDNLNYVRAPLPTNLVAQVRPAWYLTRYFTSALIIPCRPLNKHTLHHSTTCVVSIVKHVFEKTSALLCVYHSKLKLIWNSVSFAKFVAHVVICRIDFVLLCIQFWCDMCVNCGFLKCVETQDWLRKTVY